MAASRDSAALAWTPETIERFWRWQVRHPDHYFTKRFGRNIARSLSRWIGGARTVLDFGCGPGFLIPHLAALGKDVTATDHSKAAAAAANREFGAVPGFRGAVAIDELLAAGRHFEAIVSIEVIEHLSEESLGSFLSALRALAAPNATVIVTTPNEEDLDAAEVFCPHCDHTFHRYQHMRSWTAASVSATLAAAGFAVVSTYTTDFSKPPARDVIGTLKRIVKRFLGRPEKRPHLVCVARRGA
jgi:2-polyprenyl-3-methyl-5-hydroxy-6-metoxy-1,4-benzoquinol methylase